MVAEQILMTEDEAARMLGIKPQTLALWRSTGRYGLRFVKVGRLVRYRVEDVQRWLQSRVVGAEAK